MAYEEIMKQLDRLLDEKKKEFESGAEKGYDRELDEMIWKLGDYENEESLQEAKEFEEEVPLEEELAEKIRRPRRAKGTS